MKSAALTLESSTRSRVWILLPPVLALVAAAGLWLMIVYGMRIKELQYRLRSNNDQKQAVRTLSLVSRYQILRQKAGERDHASRYGREGRLMQALQHTAVNVNAADLGPAETRALWTIEFFNLIAASPRFRYEQSSPVFRVLEVAFYHELRRSYAEAIAKYTQLLESEKNLEADFRAYALLHRGFCRALVGERSAAKKDFEAVLSNHATGEYHLTAQALKAMVSEIDDGLHKVALMAPSADKGAAYYRLTAYDEAINTFKGLGNLDANPSALFYLARSHEESGGTAPAAEYYRKIIGRHAKTQWAVRANRRLFALGAFYTAGQDFRNESKYNAEKKVVLDEALLTEAARFERVAVHLEKLEAHKPAKTVVEKNEPTAKNSPLSVPVGKSEGVQQNTATRSLTVSQLLQRTAIELAKTWQQKEKLSRKDKATYLQKQKSLTRILMQDGNQFTGIVMKDGPTEIFLFTVMGKISIDKSQIASRQRVRQ